MNFEATHWESHLLALAEEGIASQEPANHIERVDQARLEDRRALLGWQVSGGSRSEPPPGWRTFVLGEITSLKVLRQTFAPRADYRPETSRLTPIEAEVERGG